MRPSALYYIHYNIVPLQANLLHYCSVSSMFSLVYYTRNNYFSPGMVAREEILREVQSKLAYTIMKCSYQT